MKKKMGSSKSMKTSKPIKKYERAGEVNIGPVRKTKVKERTPDANYVKITKTRETPGGTNTSVKTRRTGLGFLRGAAPVGRAVPVASPSLDLIGTSPAPFIKGPAMMKTMPSVPPVGMPSFDQFLSVPSVGNAPYKKGGSVGKMKMGKMKMGGSVKKSSKKK